MTLKSVDAQTLRATDEKRFAGDLFHKVSHLGSKSWVKVYTILFKGSFYVYSNVDAKQPKMVVILTASSKVEITSNRKNRYMLSFTVFSNSNDNSIRQLKFGTYSQEILSTLMKSFNESINRGVNNYFTSNKPNDFKMSLNRVNSNTHFENNVNEELFIYDMPERPVIGFKNGMPDFDLSETSSQNSIYLSIDSETYNINLDDVIFKGTSYEAYQELEKNVCYGAYLVREENNAKRLTVQTRDEVVKYVLITNTNNNFVQIQNQEMKFNSLQDLLAYYHKNDIPGRKCKLVIPYKLRKKIGVDFK